MSHSRRIIRRAHKQGSLPQLREQVEKMIGKKCFKELEGRNKTIVRESPQLHLLQLGTQSKIQQHPIQNDFQHIYHQQLYNYEYRTALSK